MITESLMYWVTRLDAIGTLIVILAVISLILSVAAAFGYLSCDIDRYDNSGETKEQKILRKFIITSFLSGIFLITANTFIPTTREMCAIKVIPAIVNNEKAQDFGNGIYDFAMQWIKRQMPNNIME